MIQLTMEYNNHFIIVKNPAENTLVDPINLSAFLKVRRGEGSLVPVALLWATGVVVCYVCLFCSWS